MRVRRRHELANIRSLGDVNELAISGHVEHEPVLRQDDDARCVCEFVLTHTTTSPFGQRWERQAYNVQAYAELGEYYATNWQPGQAILINGRLEHQLCDTLAGPLPSVWIVAHTINDTLGAHPHQQHDG
jgi:Single-strand binding protein family